MPSYPCTGCRTTAAGKLHYVYVQHFAGDEMYRRRCRLCADCLASYLPPLIEGADWCLEHGAVLTHEEYLSWNPTRAPSTTPAVTAPPAAKSSSVRPSTRTSTSRARGKQT